MFEASHAVDRIERKTLTRFKIMTVLLRANNYTLSQHQQIGSLR